MDSPGQFIQVSDPKRNKKLWARKYPNGLYLMPSDRDAAGRDIDQQIAHAIARK